MTDEDTTVNETPNDNEGQDQDQNNQEQAFLRLKRKNEKLEKQLADTTPKGDDDGQEPDIRSIVREEIKTEIQNESMLKSVLQKYPTLSDHKEKIEEYLKDDSRKNIPVDEIVAGAVGVDELIKIGASIGSQALEEARHSATGGGNAENKPKTADDKKQERYMESLPDFAK